MALERLFRIVTGFSTMSLGFVLVWSTATPAKEACRVDVGGWTEVEYRDVITGQHGIDREPVFVSMCEGFTDSEFGHSPVRA